MDDAEGDSDTQIKMTEGFFPLSERAIVLLLEHKQPGMLRRRVWTAGSYDGSFKLNFNAKIIAEQSRKYVCAAMFRVIGVIDSKALVGVCLRNEDKHLWRTRETLPVKLFFEDRPEKFLPCLFAMILAGLKDRKFI